MKLNDATKTKLKNVLVIGVTGGIGSGKSSVSNLLKDYGATILDADFIAHSVILSTGSAYKEIINKFGTTILGDNNEIERGKLASLVFREPDMLNTLNKLVHGHVTNIIMKTLTVANEKEMQNTDKKRKLFYVLDVPIPVKDGFIDISDEIWVVISDRENRIERIMKRSGYDREQAIARIDSQLSENEYTSIADRIIQNNGTYDELKERVKCMVEQSGIRNVI